MLCKRRTPEHLSSHNKAIFSFYAGYTVQDTWIDTCNPFKTQTGWLSIDYFIITIIQVAYARKKKSLFCSLSIFYSFISLVYRNMWKHVTRSSHFHSFLRTGMRLIPSITKQPAPLQINLESIL